MKKMKTYYCFEMQVGMPKPEKPDFEEMEKYCDWDGKCESFEDAAEKFFDWLDDRNEEKNNPDEYYVLIISEDKESEYYFAEASYTRVIFARKE